MTQYLTHSEYKLGSCYYIHGLCLGFSSSSSLPPSTKEREDSFVEPLLDINGGTRHVASVIVSDHYNLSILGTW